jgi:soluble lytic murein transglycosylase
MERSHPLAWHRLVLVGVVLALGVLAFMGSRGPAWFQRRYYPLAYEQAVEDSAKRHSINPYLIAAVIDSESGFDPGTVSSAGAVGLMQVMPSTANDLARRGAVSKAVTEGKDLSDPRANIEYGTAYLRYLVDRYHEVETVLAAYNAGLRHTDAWSEEGGDIREAIKFPETKGYVLRVVRARERYERLYPGAFPGWERDDS